jgi:hypothetical protein
MSHGSLWSSVVLALCLLLTVAGAAGVAACDGANSQAASTAAPGPTAVESAPALQVPAAAQVPVAVSEFRGMLPFVFTQALVEDPPYQSEKMVGDTMQTRRAEWVFRQESSDPRLSGRYDVIVNMDQRQTDMSAALWGTGRITNEGGTWVGRWTGGIAAGGDEHHVRLAVKGTGGYAGLKATMNGWFVEAGQGFTPDIQIEGAGWIETTDGSPVPPAPGPGTTPPGLTPVVGITTNSRAGYEAYSWAWNLDQSDPRVNGHLEAEVVEEGAPRPDGSIDYGGSWTQTNADGAWECAAFDGVRGTGRIEHFQYAVAKGSGAYAGLTCHAFMDFMERRDIVPGDRFVVTGWIDERE